VIVFFRSGERTFFIGGFTKSNMANISQKALAVGLHKIEMISDVEMREYDQNCIDRKDETAPGTSQSQPVTPAIAGPRT
jgi:hypothetical protein